MESALAIIEVTPAHLDELPCRGIKDTEHEGFKIKRGTSIEQGDAIAAEVKSRIHKLTTVAIASFAPIVKARSRPGRSTPAYQRANGGSAFVSGSRGVFCRESQILKRYPVRGGN